MKRAHKKSSSNAYLLVVLIFACIAGASLVPYVNKLPELSTVEIWYGGAGVKAQDISEPHATLLTFVGIVGIFGTAALWILKRRD